MLTLPSRGQARRRGDKIGRGSTKLRTGIRRSRRREQSNSATKGSKSETEAIKVDRQALKSNPQALNFGAPAAKPCAPSANSGATALHVGRRRGQSAPEPMIRECHRWECETLPTGNRRARQEQRCSTLREFIMGAANNPRRPERSRTQRLRLSAPSGDKLRVTAATAGLAAANCQRARAKNA